MPTHENIKTFYFIDGCEVSEGDWFSSIPVGYQLKRERIGECSTILRVKEDKTLEVVK